MEFLHCTHDDLYKKMYQWRGEPSTYVAYIRGKRCTSYAGLHHEISAALQFPDYYGENINALADCIEDLEWLHATNVYVVIDQAEFFLQFDQQEDHAFTKILQRAEEYWRDQEQQFHIVLSDRSMLQ